MSSDIAILILAAGGSSRMGTPKQLLPWKDTTLLGHAIQTARSIEVKTIAAVLGSNFEKIHQTISEKGIIVFEHTDWKDGLGTSIASGIEQLTNGGISFDAILIMLVDQPLISADHLNRLVQTFMKNKKGMVATAYGNRAGVPAIFDKKYFEALMKLEGEKGAKTLLKKYGEDTIILDSGENLTDLDTKADYENLLNEL